MVLPLGVKGSASETNGTFGACISERGVMPWVDAAPLNQVPFIACDSITHSPSLRICIRALRRHGSTGCSGVCVPTSRRVCCCVPSAVMSVGALVCRIRQGTPEARSCVGAGLDRPAMHAVQAALLLLLLHQRQLQCPTSKQQPTAHRRARRPRSGLHPGLQVA